MSLRRAPHHLLVAAAAAALLGIVACGGGGGGGSVSPNPGPSTTPVPTPVPSPSVVISPTPIPNGTNPASGALGGATQSLNYGTVGGYTAALTAPAATTGAATVTSTLSVVLPAGLPTVQASRRLAQSIGGTPNALAYITLTPSAAISWSSSVAFSFNVPSAPSASLAIGFYDPAVGFWQYYSGPGSVSSQTFVTFPSLPKFTALKAGVTYGFVLVSTGALATPTPNPVGNASPTACGTPNSSGAACYTIQASTIGTSVSVDGTSIGSTGATPIATTLPFSSTAHTVTLTNGPHSYSFTVDQTATSGSRTLYYNIAMDGGNGILTGNQSNARSVASLGGEARRSPASFRGPAVAAGRLYVRYDASRLTAGRSIERIESDAGAVRAFDVRSSVAAIRGRVIHVVDGTDLTALATRLRSEAAVQGVYPVHYRYARAATQVVPDDPYFLGSGFAKAAACGQSCQWDIRQIRADYAWSYTHGTHAKIAILDTGVDLASPDLVNVVYQASSVDGVLTKAAGGGENPSGYAAVQDTNGHGTNVAAIAAGSTNDGIGFAGVGYATPIYAYRIFKPSTALSDQQGATTSDEALAINDAVAQGVDVINLSIGIPQNDPSLGTNFDQVEHDAIEGAIAAGVSVVAAAGNEAGTTIDYPGAYDGVIAVGATSLADGSPNGSSHAGGSATSPIEYVPSYSNVGLGLGLVAPGGDPANSGADTDDYHWIYNASSTTAAFAADQCKPFVFPDVCKSLFAGTSQATPHVTGTIALVQSALREAGKAALTPAQIEALLFGTAENINDPGQGHGRLNALRAVEAALGFAFTLPAPASSKAQFVAFAYTNSGLANAKPAIADVFYTGGVAVSGTGTFRIVDVNPALTTGSFRIGVWLDVNGDGKIDAGDQFGSFGPCTASTPCSPGTIAVSTIPAGAFTLP